MRSSDASKVLVVDDEVEMAEFVADALEALGYEADICTNTEYIGDVFSVRHSIVVLDLFMPGLDGIEILRFLHENKARVGLIFMSGYDTALLRSASELAGEWSIPVLGTLQKPFTIDALERLLRKFKAGFGSDVPPAKNRPSHPTAETPECSLREIEAAVQEGQFRLAYQPQVDLATSRLHGYEALIRWDHPTLGKVSPAVFIPIAERTGAIGAITDFVARAAIKQLGEWHGTTGHKPCCAINISPTCLTNLDFPETLAQLAQDHGVEHQYITIEITETAVMSDVASLIDILSRLRLMRFGLSIDDFGTGYSSLQQLVRLPFSELKIDQAFIKNLTETRESRTVAKMATSLAHELKLAVVAEGIEDAITLSAARALGVDIAQGFHLGKPAFPETLPPPTYFPIDEATRGQITANGRA